MHHGVRIQDSALVAAAVLSNRYLTNRFLPDKAIDLDRRGGQSKLRIEIDSLPTEIDVVERRILQLEIETGRAREGDRRRVAASGSTRSTTSSPRSTPRSDEMKRALGGARSRRSARSAT